MEVNTDRPPSPPMPPMDLATHVGLANGSAFHEGLPTPIPPPTLPLDPPAPSNDHSDDHPAESEDGSGSEDGVSEGDDESRWYHIEEDKSEPCSDELAFIESREEHSALNHAYFETQAFSKLNDPELEPIENGTIDWLVEHFNGTKENPNNETIMRSPMVRIAGYDWQIKFYPRGDKGEYLSIYIECVSMLSTDFAEFEDFQDPPFPFLKGQDPIKKRRSVAVQFCVVMYNPGEPRVYEHQIEASQFCKSNPNFGWKYFTRYPRYDFHMRQHTQRQSILRDDKLAFKAFIRVIKDPTGCLWENNRLPDVQTSITGLRPFTKSLQYIAAAVPLLHFAPFRKFIQEARPTTRAAIWLQSLLLKMYTRKRSTSYGSRGAVYEADVVEMLHRLSLSFMTDYTDGSESSTYVELIGAFHAEKGTACGQNRLNTKDYPAIQAAVNSHTKSIAPCALLTLELQRQEHDKKERKWKKLTNNVNVEENITVAGFSYSLFAFITHCGHLQSSRYNSYVRPRGPANGWFAYQDGKVTRLTEKQARDRHSGIQPDDDRSRTPEDGYDSPFSELHEPTSEVACAVMYIRQDFVAAQYDGPSVEDWIPPQLRQERPGEIPKTTVQEGLGNSQAVDGTDGAALPAPEEAVQLQPLAARIEAEAAAPTPDPVLMDGEDVVMKDVDDESTYSIEGRGPEPILTENLETGTRDWLGRSYYEGSWKATLPHGGGHLIDTNGDEYLGSFKDGQKHGWGKMVYAATGDIYEGDWADDQPNGRGKLTELFTGNVYEGGFKDGAKHGDFVLRGTVTEEDKSCCSICYEKEMSTAFYDCGHVVACRDCAGQVDICPVCRRRVVARLQLYGVRVAKS